MTTSESKVCVVCAGTRLKRERAYRSRHGMFSHSWVVRCCNCDLLQIAPMPTLDELDAYYAKEYRPASLDAFSSPYEDTNNVNFRTRSQSECIQKLGIEVQSIVDVGCGFGLLLNSLRQIFPHARLFGIEISQRCHPALDRLRIEQAHTTLDREDHNPFG